MVRRKVGHAPPSPDDPGWSDWVDGHISETEYDETLARKLAEDAYRVRDGDLSAEAFQERYHEEMLAEFGLDERATKDTRNPGVPDADSNPGLPAPSLGGTDDDGGPSRRDVLKTAGGVAALGVTLPGCLGTVGQTTTMHGSGEDAIAATQSLSDTEGTQMGMVIDLERCQGELECMVACKEENNTSQGVHWNYVFHYTDPARVTAEGEEPSLEYMPRTCQHCSRPTCTYVCPTEARFKREEDGIVLTDYDQCIGCRYCEVACPYGVNFFSWGDPSHYEEFEQERDTNNGITAAGNPPGGNMGKCTFCVHRQDSGDEELEGTTACEEACPWGAITFGDLSDPEGKPQQHLQEKSGTHTFRLLESVGNSPNVIYVGDEPSMDAEQTDVSPLEEKGFVVNRREVLSNSERTLTDEENGGNQTTTNGTATGTPTTEGEQ